MRKRNQGSGVVAVLRAAGLRPTIQRRALARLLLGSDHRHVTAEQLHTEARAAGVHVSLATVYNTLHQFTEAGLLRELVVDSGCSCFDTNTAPHHHFYDVDLGRLIDIPGEALQLPALPSPPEGSEISSVDVIVRIRSRDTPHAGGA
jgi:Fur family iron response transcriptional regulator